MGNSPSKNGLPNMNQEPPSGEPSDPDDRAPPININQTRPKKPAAGTPGATFEQDLTMARAMTSKLSQSSSSDSFQMSVPSQDSLTPPTPGNSITTHTPSVKLGGSHLPSPPALKKNRTQLVRNGEIVDIDLVIDKLMHSKRRSGSFIIPSYEVAMICSKAREIFLQQPSLLKLAAPVKIVGDIHGQFSDLLRILKLSGLPSETNYLFLGDYVDRGKQSLETILLLLCFKIKYPDNFFMLRGNHETASVTKMYGFYDECKRRMSIKTWKHFVDVFNCLPFAAIISDKIFCVHGGISPSLTQLSQIDSIARPTDIPEDGLLTDLLWSDPDPKIATWELNDRGVSYCFGKKQVDEFLKRFNFDLVIRGHMVVEDGYEFFAKKRFVTVFSAPNYCGEFSNWGAVMSVTTGMMCSFELLKPTDLKKK